MPRQMNGGHTDRNAKVDFFDARVTKDLFQMPAGPLSMALGYEWRKEESQLRDDCDQLRTN